MLQLFFDVIIEIEKIVGLEKLIIVIKNLLKIIQGLLMNFYSIDILYKGFSFILGGKKYQFLVFFIFYFICFLIGGFFKGFRSNSWVFYFD